MYFYETNGQVDQIKEHVNPITNASQPQLLMKRNYIIKQRMSNEYRSKGFANCIMISKMQWAYRQE
jgi:hypothetical protein